MGEREETQDGGRAKFATPDSGVSRGLALTMCECGGEPRDGVLDCGEERSGSPPEYSFVFHFFCCCDGSAFRVSGQRLAAVSWIVGRLQSQASIPESRIKNRGRGQGLGRIFDWVEPIGVGGQRGYREVLPVSVACSGSGVEGWVPQMRLASSAGLREPWETPPASWAENTKWGDLGD